MGHLVDEEYLYRENIEEYLEALAKEIKKAGVGKHRILIVGGAAMAIKCQDGRSTVDTIEIHAATKREYNQLVKDYKKAFKNAAKNTTIKYKWVKVETDDSQKDTKNVDIKNAKDIFEILK